MSIHFSYFRLTLDLFDGVKLPTEKQLPTYDNYSFNYNDSLVLLS